MSDDNLKNTLIKYLEHELSENSLMFYEVNGNPGKRCIRIKEFAYHLYTTMNNVSRLELYKKIQDQL
jgi:hypothetical protein